MVKGKIEIQNRVTLDNTVEEKSTLGLIYTPGVAYIAKEISNNKELVYEYTSKWNNVAIICDGTRVLGLGNVGPESALPVMEGKSVLFKVLGGINAYPLCISTTDKEEIISFVKAVEPVFGAVNIEDIESPKVLEIIERLRNELSIPVFHDDQHGTAVITFSALTNALRLLGKKLTEIKIVISGAGSAGYGIFRILNEAGCRNIIVTDSKGSIYEGRNESLDNSYKLEIAKQTNSKKLQGTLADVIKKADVFIGVSGKADLLNNDMVKSMNPDPVILALSNPDPEILPEIALQSGARIVATGRSDFPNQVNNALVFPSILRTLLDLRVKTIQEDILVEVAKAIAGLVADTHLKEDYIIPEFNDPRILPIVNQTLKRALQGHTSLS
jgi:malate dehydrogenase (oxaloacetate-decarboxylating)